MGFTITELMFGCALLLTLSNICTMVISNHRQTKTSLSSSSSSSSLLQQLTPLPDERAAPIRTPAGAGEPTLTERLRGSYSSATAQSGQVASSALSSLSPLLNWFYSSKDQALLQKQQEQEQLQAQIAQAQHDLTSAMGLTGFSDHETEAVGVEYTAEDRAALAAEWSALSPEAEQRLQAENKSPNEPEEGEDMEDPESAVNFDEDMEQDVEVDPVLPKGFDVEFGRD